MKRPIMLAVAMLLAANAFSVAFRDGEKLTFTVKYGLISAGEATMTARSSTYQGVPVWYLSVAAKTFPFFDPMFKVRDKVESWWDKTTLLPYKSSKQLQEGKYRQHRVHTYDQPNLKTTYNKWSYKRNAWNSEDMELPWVTQDVLSAFYEVRNMSLTPGKPVAVNITTDGRSGTAQVLVHRREKISSIFGKIECLVIEPKLKGEAVFKQKGNIYIWITDDSYKIPVRMESAVTFGSFVAKLSDADNVPYLIKYPEN